MEKFNALLKRFKGKLILISGIICFILPWTFAFGIIPLPAWLDNGFGAYVIVAMVLYGMIAPFVGLHVIGTEEEEERTKRHIAYNNPQWRKDNPQLAALVEQEKEAERAHTP